MTTTFNAPTRYVDIRALEYSGLDPVNPLDVGTSASGTGTSASSGTASTTAANALIFGAGITTGGFSTAGTNFTTRIITVPDADIAQDRLVTAAGAYNATAPLGGSAAWVMQMAAFKAAGARGGDSTPATSTPSGQLLASADFTTGNFSKVILVQNKFYDSVGAKYPSNTYYPATIVTDPVHGNVARFEVRTGDWPGFASGERSEVRPTNQNPARSGETRWYSWYTKFDTTYPASHDGYWNIQFQFHGNDAAPPAFSFSTYNNTGGTNSPADRWALQIGGGGTGLGVWSTPINRGVWHKMKMQVFFSQDPSRGWIKLWHDDVPQTFSNGTTTTYGATINPGSNQYTYAQFGTYRGTQVRKNTDIVYHTKFKYGTTEASVS